MFKKIISMLVIVVLCMALSITASAAATTPNEVYTRVDVPGGSTEHRLTREMYKAEKYIDATSLGLSQALEGITDLSVADNGEIIILCGEKSRIVILNTDYTLKCELNVIDAEGNSVDFTGAQGIYRDKDGLYFLADTLNARILIFGEDGVITKELGLPDSEFIPSDFVYQPAKIAKDSDGYLYVLSNGSYYGAMQYKPNYEFMGFYGSSTVQASALDTLQYLWDKLTSNETKQSKSTKKLPYSFADFDFDSYDYLVTSTGKTSKYNNKGDVGQIRKISHNGASILYKRNTRDGYVDSSSINFLETTLVVRQARVDGRISQNLVAVAVGRNDFMYALDNTHGLVYLFDSECNLLNTFGGGLQAGTQVGAFTNAVAMDLKGDSVLVADKDNKSVTVFNLTEYGELLLTAQNMFIKGDYLDSKPYWEKVLALDSGNQLAYRALASAYYNEGEYEKALEYAEIGLDYNIYDLSHQEVLSKHLAKYFGWYLLALAIVIGGVIYVTVYCKKHNKKLVTNQKLITMGRVTFHPFDAFNDIKYRKHGSMIISVVLCVLLYIAFFLRDVFSGFLYTTTNVANYNSIYTIGKTIGFVLLWSVCYWLVSSMASGKGTLREIFTVTSYSLVPLIVYSFVRVIITNFLPYSAYGLITGIDTVVLIFTFFLIAIGMLTVNEYDFFKFLITAVVTVFFMILVVFVIFMCALMIAQAWDFISSVYTEVVYRR